MMTRSAGIVWAQLAGLGCAFLLSLSGPAFAQEDRLARFSAYSADSERRIDYEVWSRILSSTVFDVGMSDRRPAGQAPRMTASRIPRGAVSRYRFEANRVLFHAIGEEAEAQVSGYRAALEALPGQVSLASLSRDEQLAYWLNLHNVIVYDEILKRYPITRLDDPTSHDPHSLFNRPVATIEGVSLSLNDIRLGIVGANWSDPRVIYGFFTGALGGPSIQTEAFSGTRIWRQLDRPAREYVNALRGVESAGREDWRVSALHVQHRDLFPDWPDDLRAHLADFARASVSAILAESSGAPRRIDFDTTIADLTNGRPCSGSAFPGTTARPNSNSVDFGTGCGLPPESLELIDYVRERLIDQRRNAQGEVTIHDPAPPAPQGG